MDTKKAAAIEALILNTFMEVHRIYNNWNPESEISQLNRLPAKQKVALSLELASFLAQVDRIVAQTEGRFDPTVDPLQRLWKGCLQAGRLPSQEEQEHYAQAIGWNKIHLENGFFWKEHPLTAIDLGGIAKGYAVDLLCERLVHAGYPNVYVEWGGEIRTCGSRSQKEPWRVAIYRPPSLTPFPPIELKNSSIATSGSYVQNWEIEQVCYTHIIDPRTQYPLHDAPISSATVIAPTCTEADALATALMLFPSKEEAHFWAEEKKIKVYIW
jgi:FAD:protein FMN transferase